MTDANELRKLLEKATPLPWREVVTRYERPGECIESASLDDVGCPTRVVDASSSGMEGGGFMRAEDLRLVVAAINALPSMLDQLEARNEEAQRLNRLIGDSGAWTIQAVQELDAARAEVAAVEAAICDRGVSERDCGLPLAERVDHILLDLKQCRFDLAAAEMENTKLRAQLHADDQRAWEALGKPEGTYTTTNVQRLCAEVERLRAKLRRMSKWHDEIADSLRAEVERLCADLREAMELLRLARGRFQSYEECDQDYCADGSDHQPRARMDALLAKHKETP